MISESKANITQKTAVLANLEVRERMVALLGQKWFHDLERSG